MRGKVRLNFWAIYKKGFGCFGFNSWGNIQGKRDILSECHSNIRFNIYITRAAQSKTILGERNGKTKRCDKKRCLLKQGTAVEAGRVLKTADSTFWNMWLVRTREAITMNGRNVVARLICHLSSRILPETTSSNHKVEKKKKHREREKFQHECLTHKQKVKSNVHIARGFLLYFLAQRDRSHVAEQTKHIN